MTRFHQEVCTQEIIKFPFELNRSSDYLRDRHKQAAANCDGGKWQKSYSVKVNSMRYLDRV